MGARLRRRRSCYELASVILSDSEPCLAVTDGWEYSFGCCHEFALARRISLPTFDESGEPLGADEGADLIVRAIHDVRSTGGSTVLLDNALRSVRDHRSEAISSSGNLQTILRGGV